MSNAATADQYAWPIATLDFEASALGRLSYPIEIGIAIWRSPDSPIETWSSLIQPTEDWRRKGLRTDSADKIHLIPRKQLDHAPTPAEVLTAANLFLGVGAVAHCDGGGHDAYWLNRLEDAAEIAASFTLSSSSILRNALSSEQRDIYDAHVSEPSIHRAGPDAQMLLEALRRALEQG